MPTKTEAEKKASKARLKAHLAKLEKQSKEEDRVKRANLRTKAAKGSRKVRKKAATELSNMPRQFKD